jgi:hypothetical protein
MKLGMVHEACAHARPSAPLSIRYGAVGGMHLEIADAELAFDDCALQLLHVLLELLHLLGYPRRLRQNVYFCTSKARKLST